MARQLAVHSINPKQLDRFRDRISPAGAKDDRRDARVLADALRTGRRYFRRLRKTAIQRILKRHRVRAIDADTAMRHLRNPPIRVAQGQPRPP